MQQVQDHSAEQSAPTADRVHVGSSAYNQIVEYLYEEAALLDKTPLQATQFLRGYDVAQDDHAVACKVEDRFVRNEGTSIELVVVVV